MKTALLTRNAELHSLFDKAMGVDIEGPIIDYPEAPTGRDETETEGKG